MSATSGDQRRSTYRDGALTYQKRCSNRKPREPQWAREPEIEWTHAPRLPPGDYPAISRGARIYFDPQFKRWVCTVQFDILSDSLLMEPVARLTWFLNLGSSRAKPRAGRRGKYWAAWVRANGAPPERADRLSPRIFEGRCSVVRVVDTSKSHDRGQIEPEQAYSVVRDVIEWQTGGRTR